MSTAPLRVNGLKYGVSDTSIYVTAFGAKGDGVTDDTAAIQAAFAAAVAGQVIYFPSGNYLVTDTCTVTKDNVHVWGTGVRSCKVTFNPASAKACFKVDNAFAGSDRTYGGTTRGIFFVSGNTTQQKIAIDLVDTSGYVVREVWVDPTNSSTPPWRGANSIGIRYRGRELTRTYNVRLWADTPVQISADPYVSSPVSCDHFHMSGSYLLATPGGGNACFKIDDGIIVTNFTIDGDNAWIVDKYGFYWVETGGTSAVAQNIQISNVRMEQATDLTGDSIHIDHTKGIYNLTLNTVAAAINQDNSFLIKGVTNLSLLNTWSGTNNAAKHHVNFDRITDLAFLNCYWQINTLATLTGLTATEQVPNAQSAATLPPSGKWSNTTALGTKGFQVNKLDAIGGGSLAIGANSSALAFGQTGGSGVTVNDPILAFNHLKGGTAAPTIAIVGSPTQLGTSPSFAVINGHDCSLNLSITVGSTPAAFVDNTAVSLATVTFNKTYTGGAPMLAIVPTNAAAAYAMASGIQFFFNRSGSTTTTGNIRCIAKGTPSFTAAAVMEFVMVAIQ